jgi:hypothetical protein
MSRKAVLLALLAVTIPFTASPFARADSQVDFANRGGTLSGTNSGMTLTGSVLSGVQGYPGWGPMTGNLGTVSFGTGALISGTLQSSATFAAGGTFTIAGNGTNGLPNGTIFNGTFSTPVSWQLSTQSNGTHTYTLSGSVTGMITVGGQTYYVSGAPVVLSINTGTGYFNGSASNAQGKIDVNCRVPEAGSLYMLGACMLTLVGAITLGAIRRKRIV